jgi:hypothetical protein
MQPLHAYDCTRLEAGAPGWLPWVACGSGFLCTTFGPRGVSFCTLKPEVPAAADMIRLT